LAGTHWRYGEGFTYSPEVVSVQLKQDVAISPDAAADLLDVLLRKLRKTNEMSSLLRQEREATWAGDRDACHRLRGLRQRLQEQLLALEGEYRRAKQEIAHQVGLDDMDFATLAGCLPPEPAAFLRRAGLELSAAVREAAALGAEIGAETARQATEPAGEQPAEAAIHSPQYRKVLA